MCMYNRYIYYFLNILNNIIFTQFKCINICLKYVVIWMLITGF